MARIIKLPSRPEFLNNDFVVSSFNLIRFLSINFKSAHDTIVNEKKGTNTRFFEGA